MTPERRQHIEQLSELARQHGAAFLQSLNPDTRRDVEELLRRTSQNESTASAETTRTDEATPGGIGPGAQVGPYKIEVLLGQGGMGQVFRASDTRLGRRVAIKISREAFTGRFEREAKSIAALNHPNVCTLYDVGPNYLVMELVEGETLAARLTGGALPITQTIDYATQIARALVAAHARGIIHRDLKPGNVVLSASGAKVLDFGIAKSEQDETLTVTGAIPGTPAYMAPEHREGRPGDARSDIFALGIVIYEMATGRRPPSGEPPPLGALPERLAHIVERCLAPDPNDRWQSARDVELELGWAAQTPAAAPPARRSRGLVVALALAAVALVALAATVLVGTFRAAPDVQTLSATILPPEGTSFNFTTNAGPIALSPDGRRAVFAATGTDGSRQLWLRELDSLEARPLRGTENARHPFWSPDSVWVGFFADGLLKKVDTRGGAPVVLTRGSGNEGGPGAGATWGTKGQIVFSFSLFSPLLKVSSDGGPTSVAAETDLSGNGFPWFLPDGEHFLFSSWAGSGQILLRVGSLDTTATEVIGAVGSNAIYSVGYLLYLRNGSLVAHRFDLATRRTAGDPVVIAESVQVLQELVSPGVFSTSATGLLAYQKGGGIQQSQLTWVDRSGNTVGILGEPRVYWDIEPSPDGATLLASSPDAVGNYDLWTYDVTRGVRTRFTSDPAGEYFGRWSADGTSVVFNSTRGGRYDLYRKPANGAGPEELLYADDTDKVPVGLSHDGRFLLYFVSGERYSLWLLPLTPEQPGAPLKPRRLLDTQFNQRYARFSPDDQWIAYETDESGRSEIYVAPFARPMEKHQVSSDGGALPRWRRDGRGLVYVSTTDGRLREAEIRLTGDTVDVLSVRPVFSAAGGVGGYGYAVAPDGQRALTALLLPKEAPEPVTLVQNWQARLR